MLLSSSRDDIFRRRQMRHAADKCEKFLLGDEAKREFYSPNYPNPYPNHTECVRVLEGKFNQKKLIIIIIIVILK